MRIPFSLVTVVKQKIDKSLFFDLFRKVATCTEIDLLI